MFPETVLTDRLRLERLSRETVDTLAFYDRLSNSDTIEEETRYVTWGPHDTPAETRAFLVRAEEEWEAADTASYAVFPRQGEDGAGEHAGNAGLSVDWAKRSATLGVWLRKPFWGRGYSGERAGALLQLAFDRLDLDLVSVAHHVDNGQSRRAIGKYVERYGGHEEGVLRNWLVDDDGGVHDAVRYSVSREEWAAAVGSEREADLLDGDARAAVQEGERDVSGGNES